MLCWPLFLRLPFQSRSGAAAKEALDEQTVRRTVHEAGYGISGFKIIS